MEDPALHRRFTDALFAAWNMLFRYKRYFSEYNDHSGLHSIGVIEYCNLLAGEDQIRSLNADEIYVLLMACCLHDAGMGISPEEFDEFSRSLDLEEYFRKEGSVPRDRIIRDFHQEFSALLIDRYAPFLELPSPEHLFAVRQVVRGHRKTDLFDAGSFESPQQAFYYKRTRACRKVEVTKDALILHVRTDDPLVAEGLEQLRQKIQETLDLCRDAAEKRTTFRLTQSRVELKTSL